MSACSSSSTSSSSSSSSSSFSSSSSSVSAVDSVSDSSNQVKWDTLYTLRERIVLFILQLERRTRLYPPPFHRATVGGDAVGSDLAIRHSETISHVAKAYLLGVFKHGENDTVDRSGTCLCNYAGWLLTQEEYAELNNEHNLNMTALYGVGVPLHAFVLKHWNEEVWDPAWKEVEWVLLGDPVTTGANINTLTGTAKKVYNAEIHVNCSKDMKVATKDGRYAVLSEMVTIHKQPKVAVKVGDEIFIAYDNVVKEKQQVLQERAA
jgi:hypothetical protein